MDYLGIILDGYFNNNRKYLDDYFFREFKKAEKSSHYSSSEFFDGCNKIIIEFKEHIQMEFNARQRVLHIMLNGARDGTLLYDDEELRKASIQNSEKELSRMKESHYSAHLHQLTGGLKSGEMRTNELRLIKDALSQAQQKAEREGKIEDKVIDINKESEEIDKVIAINKKIKEEDRIIDVDKELEEIRKAENRFWKGLPMDIVVDHFVVMTDTKSKNGKPFLSSKQLISFLKRGFLKDTNEKKQKINFAYGEKGFVIKRFHKLYEIAAKDYYHPNKKEKFIALFISCFNNWNESSVKAYFKPNKTKKNW